MEKLVLAKCINSTFSDTELLNGECYLIQPAPRAVAEGTSIHQGNVYAYHVPDSLLTAPNFILLGSLYVATEGLLEEIKASREPVYTGARYRFELIFTPGAFQSALQRAASRRDFSASSSASA